MKINPTLKGSTLSLPKKSKQEILKAKVITAIFKKSQEQLLALPKLKKREMTLGKKNSPKSSKK